MKKILLSLLIVGVMQSSFAMQDDQRDADCGAAGNDFNRDIDLEKVRKSIAGDDVDAKNSALMGVVGSYRLMKAVVREEFVSLLIDAGADVNSKDNAGFTVLMLAALRRDKGVLRLLIAACANVDAIDNNGETALMLAVFYGQTEAVQLLIATGADVNVRNNDGETALMHAARLGYTETVGLLITAGADVNTKNNQGIIALQMARKDEIIQLLRGL